MFYSHRNAFFTIRLEVPIKHGHRWKGGRVVDPRGYILLRRPEHPRADIRGYVYEHIVVAEKMLGRPILDTEEVHHRNENKSDNSATNLYVAGNHAEHALHHRSSQGPWRAVRLPGEPNPMIECACGCGALFLKYDKVNRERRYVFGWHARGRRGTGKNA
jgi:hypothetical protein